MNFNKMKVKELKSLCKENKIKRYSKLKKRELIEKLENIKNQNGPAPTRPQSPLLEIIRNKIK